MSDAAARREARIKRILENSESRLRNITARVDDELLSNESKKAAANEDDTNSSSVANDIALKKLLNNKDYTMGALLEDTLGLEDEEPQWLSTDSEMNEGKHTFHGATARNRNLPRFQMDDTDYRQPPREQDVKRSNVPQMNDEMSNPTIVTKMPLLFFLVSNRMTYVVLAIVVNIFLHFNMDFVYGKVVLLPCFILMSIRLFLSASLVNGQGGNLLIASLILCNIKPSLIHSLTKLSTFFSIVTKDLAVYMFSFVLTYAMFSMYLESLTITIETERGQLNQENEIYKSDL